jgi:ribosomal protein S18 acetylase RimI-like enzyme
MPSMQMPMTKDFYSRVLMLFWQPSKKTMQRTIMHLSVRQAGLADIDRVAPLFDQYRQFYEQPSDPALSRAFIHERLALLESVIFLAENENGDAVGFVQLYPLFSSISARRSWMLNDLFVSPAARRSGVASALLNAAKAHAKATGAKSLELSTAHDNPAQKLYESHGYVRDKIFYYYSLDVD